MKKILTLVVAFALVFAIAAPALAITGDLTPEETNPVAAPVAMSVELFTAPEQLQMGAFSLSAIASNKAFVVNELAFYGIALKFNVDDDDHDLTLQPADYEGAVLTISCDAFALTATKAADAYAKLPGETKITRQAPYGLPALNGDDELEMTFAAGDPWETKTELYFFGQGTVAAKGVLKATLVKEAGSPLDIFKADGTLRYRVTETVDTNFVVDPDITDAEEGVRFDIDEHDEVTGIFVNGNEVEFKKLVSGGGTVVAAIGGETEGDDFDAWKKLYDGVMSFFGFNYDAEGRLLMKHFASKAALLNLKSEKVVQLYSAAIVVPGSIEPPKTGDASTVIGFVMIVLAMVACGVVVSRKVRA